MRPPTSTWDCSTASSGRPPRRRPSSRPHNGSIQSWSHRVRARARSHKRVPRRRGDHVASRLDLPRIRRIVLVLIVALPMLFNAIAVLPEVGYEVPNVNDDAEHVLFIQQASDAWANGQDPLDFWVPQVELGFPQFLYYQNLPHLVVVALGKLTFGLIPLRTLFDLVRYALLVGFPLTVFWTMRRLGFSDVAGAIGAAAGSLISGNNRYGFEYDSYVWRGLGVYTQIFGMHLSFLALAALHRVATRGSGVVAAALVCAALALSHLIFAYLTAIHAVVLFSSRITRPDAR